MGFAPRLSFQFHWHNRGYASYDDFLAGLTSRKRKQLRKERRRALQKLDGPVEFVAGVDLDEADIRAMDRYYRRTVYAHGGMDYLRPGFFTHLAELLPDHVLFARAARAGRVMAGALFFETPFSQGSNNAGIWECQVILLEICFTSQLLAKAMVQPLES